jgi:hypothetical protein
MTSSNFASLLNSRDVSFFKTAKFFTLQAQARDHGLIVVFVKDGSLYACSSSFEGRSTQVVQQFRLLDKPIQCFTLASGMEVSVRFRPDRPKALWAVYTPSKTAYFKIRRSDLDMAYCSGLVFPRADYARNKQL